MKYTIRQVPEGEDEVVLQYRNRTPEVDRIIRFLEGNQVKLSGWKEKELVVVDPAEILYIESVDGKVFAYTGEDVFRLEDSLAQLEVRLGNQAFFRCSKSMIINIRRVQKLKSMPSNRIDATMENGEHVMIARTYATDFRRILKGGARHE